MSISTISPFNISLLWFGAAVSIAEILTGTLLAPLGMTYGLSAILLGHLIGGLMLFLAGFIGADRQCTSAESINLFFGKFGSAVFSALNIIQLIGWITILIIIGSEAVNFITASLWQMTSHSFIWTAVLGLTPCIWIFFRGKFINNMNRLIMLCLLIVSLWLGFNSLFGENLYNAPPEGSISFGAAVELNVVMCLSWLPVISDYTRKLQRRMIGTFCSASAYCLGSSLMFAIGLGSAVHFHTTGICDIFSMSGLGIIALIVILLSTVTTNFVPTNSASLCFKYLFPRIDTKIIFVVICLISIFLACFFSIQQYENFLYFIGASFAPLFAISFSEFFLIKNSTEQNNKIIIKNCLLWLLGFIIYENLIDYTTFVGITFPVMLGIAVFNLLVSRLLGHGFFSLKKFTTR